MTIVVVGANDGKLNDPLYTFAVDAANTTRVLLIEPNARLIPYLEANYAAIAAHQICACAIGQPDTLVLYAIKERYWPQFQPPYAAAWPLYRAPTGITSASRAHLEAALAKHSDLDPNEAIEAFEVPCKKLPALLDEVGWKVPIDVLQVDAESCDDLVLYACDLEVTRPKLIFFESMALPRDRREHLHVHLARRGYRSYRCGGDTLSVHDSVRLLELYIVGRRLLDQAIKRLRPRAARGR